MFLQVSVCPHWGGHAWFYWGVCMVLFGGHAWFYSGGMRGFIQGVRGFIQGVCGFIQGGMHGFSGGHAWFFWGCMVFPGGVHGFFSFFGYNEIRSMSGRYASYWNAFLFHNISVLMPPKYRFHMKMKTVVGFVFAFLLRFIFFYLSCRHV